jgi:hypothetical protein
METSMRKLPTFLIALSANVVAVVSPVSAQGFNGGGFNIGLGPFATGGGCSQATTFLGRATAASLTIDSTHTTAYTNLICGMVAQSATEGGTLWARFDLLFIYATNTTSGTNTTLALLNLPNSTYSGSLVSTPTFTADRGFTGDGTTTGVTTNFNPTIATSPQFQANSAHLSTWDDSTSAIMETNPLLADVTNSDNIYPWYSGTDFYSRINDSPNTGPLTIGDPRGHLLGNRDSSTSRQSYQNAGTLGSYGSAPGSGVVPNSNSMGLYVNAGAGSSRRVAMLSAGASLSATDVTNFYTLLRAYMTAVGVP